MTTSTYIRAARAAALAAIGLAFGISASSADEALAA
jgi:hypothetical protein